MSKENRDVANELSEKIRERNRKKQEEQEEEELKARRRKRRQEELEEEEEENRRKRGLQNEDTEEDDENLKEDNENNQQNDRDRKKSEKQEQEQDKNEQDDIEEDNDKQDNKEDKTKESDESKQSQNDDKGREKKPSENNVNQNQNQQNNYNRSSQNSAKNQSNTQRGQSGMNASPEPNGSAGVNSVSTGSTAKNGVSAGQATAGSAKTGGAVGTKMSVLGTVIVVILIIVVLVGIIFFFITMPGAVIGKIGDAINSFRRAVDGFISGDDYAKIMVSRKHMINAAEYLDQMGYDLEGYGFLSEDVDCVLTARNDESWLSKLNDWWDENDVNESPTYKNFSTKSLEERKEEDPDGDFVEVYVSFEDEFVENYLALEEEKKNELKEQIENGVMDIFINPRILLVKDSEGNVEFVKSKYLLTYLTADNAVYLVRNYNTDISNRAAKLINSNDTEKGSGLITFIDGGKKISKYVANSEAAGISSEFADAESWGIFDRVSVNRAERSMTIENSDDGWLRTSYFTYNLDGWATKYGVPLQLSLVNHLSTLAPEFAYQVAKMGAQDTMVKFGLVESTGNTFKMKLYLDIDGSGKKYYYIEKKKSSNWDLTSVAEDDSGESSYKGSYNAKQVLGYADDTDLQTIEDQKPQSKTGQELIEEINALEEELKQVTNNGENKIDIGEYILAFHLLYGDQSPFDKYVDDEATIANMFGQNIDGRNVNNLNWIYKDEQGESPSVLNVQYSEYFSKLAKILYNNGLVEIKEILDHTMHDENDKYYYGFELNNNNPEAVLRLKNIFLTYFYQTGDIIESIENKEGYKINYEQMPIVETDENGIKVYKNTEDKAVEMYQSGDETWAYSEYKEDKYLILNKSVNYNNNGTWNTYDGGFYKASMETIWEFLFNEKKYNYYNYFIQLTRTIKEPRVFYRLIDANTNQAYTDIGENPDEFIYIDENEMAFYISDEGWFWKGAIPKKLESAFNKEFDDDEEGITAKEITDVLDKIDDAETNNYTKYIPIILSVENHWYQDISFEGCYKWDTSEEGKKTVSVYQAGSSDGKGLKKSSEKDILYTEEQTKGTIVQIADAKTEGVAGQKIKELLEKKYDIYDGVSKSNKYIDFKDTAVDAIAMLEEIKGEDSQEIIRMYKELMMQYGIYFQESEQTSLKKELFSKVIEGYNDKEKIISEGDDSVIKAEIPPLQDGFGKELNILTPISGRIIYRTDECVCIEIIAQGEEFDGYTILISGFDVDASVSVGQKLNQGIIIGKTKRQDLKLTLRDENGAIVKNEYTTEILHDYNVKISGQKYTKEELINIFTQYRDKYGIGQLLIDNVDAFYEIQSKYGVDPLFAAAVTITESSAGTAETTLIKEAYNWVSIQGSKNGGYAYNSNLWNKYSSYADAISGEKGFGDLIANGSYYFQDGKYKISEIGLKYCNADWAVCTSNFMNELIELGGKGNLYE